VVAASTRIELLFCKTMLGRYAQRLFDMLFLRSEYQITSHTSDNEKLQHGSLLHRSVNFN
jgi:hypothetical protein